VPRVASRVAGPSAACGIGSCGLQHDVSFSRFRLLAVFLDDLLAFVTWYVGAGAAPSFFGAALAAPYARCRSARSPRFRTGPGAASWRAGFARRRRDDKVAATAAVRRRQRGQLALGRISPL